MIEEINVVTVRDLFQEQLIIPEYQRPYKWKEKHVTQLLNDIFNSINTGKEIYRMGTVILHKEKGNDNLNIVDGQQRLITITLILNFLDYQDSPLLKKSKFPHPISKGNIKNNHEKIRLWFNNLSNDIQPDFKKFILEKCEFVKIQLTEISEAFQLFDSQNARGKALEPYDLLKAFHLREMNVNTKDERLNCVQKWENAVNEGLLNNLGKYLYRIRKWSIGKPAYEFTKDDIEEFKGINLNDYKDYPYLKPYLLNEIIINEMRKNPINEVFGAQLNFPFQITQEIINGKLFFEYVAFYAGLYRELFVKNDSGFFNFYENHCKYQGSQRTGDKYVREMFKASVLYYQDKFGKNDFDKIYVVLYRWNYKLRLRQTRVQYNSIDKYILEDDKANLNKNNVNLFDKIRRAYHPNEILNLKRSIQMTNNYAYPIESIKNAFENEINN